MAIRVTSSQRAFLRGRARALRPQVVVGKAGLSAAVIQRVASELSRRELVKVRLPGSTGPERRRAAEQLAKRTAAAVVDVVGRMVVLYRPSEELPAEKRLALP